MKLLRHKATALFSLPIVTGVLAAALFALPAQADSQDVGLSCSSGAASGTSGVDSSSDYGNTQQLSLPCYSLYLYSNYQTAGQSGFTTWPGSGWYSNYYAPSWSTANGGAGQVYGTHNACDQSGANCNPGGPGYTYASYP